MRAQRNIQIAGEINLWPTKRDIGLYRREMFPTDRGQRKKLSLQTLHLVSWQVGKKENFKYYSSTWILNDWEDSRFELKMLIVNVTRDERRMLVRLPLDRWW